MVSYSIAYLVSALSLREAYNAYQDYSLYFNEGNLIPCTSQVAFKERIM